MHLRLSVMNWPPISMIVPREEGGIRIEGVMKHMLQIMVKHYNLSYTLIQPSSGNYGSFINGSWNGLVGTLVDNKADIAFNTLVNTEARYQVMDYSQPFHRKRFSILSLKQSENSELGLMEYLLAVNLHVWLHILSIIIIIAIINSVIISKLNIHTRKDIIDFFWIFFTQIWDLLQIMLVEFQWKRTTRHSSSYISILFLFFALLAFIFSVIMNAFVGVSFIVGNEVKMIDSLEQLVKEEEIIPVIIGGGTSLENELRTSNSQASKTIWKRIGQHRHEALLPGLKNMKDESFLEGIMSRKFAFIGDENNLKQVKLDCCSKNPNVHFHISGGSAMTTMAGLGFRKGLDKKVVRKLENMVQRLVISSLTNQWFEDGYSKLYATNSLDIKACFDDANSDLSNYSSIGFNDCILLMSIACLLWVSSVIIFIFEYFQIGLEKIVNEVK